jgi:hypothetical protein
MIQIADRLLEQTVEGGREWEPAGSFTFRTWVSGRPVTVESADRDGAHPYVLSILEPDGRTIESVRTGSPMTVELRGGARGDWEAGLEQLYRLARRRALKVDEVIDDVLHSLTE